MVIGKVEVVFKDNLTVGEGPHYIEEENALVFVDIPAHTVFRYDCNTGSVTKGVIPDVKEIGFIIPVREERNKFLIGADQTVAILEWDGKDADNLTVKVVDSVDELKGNRFNDAKCDRSGRLWLGTMGSEESPGEVKKHTAALYSLNSSGSLEKKLKDVSLSNGLGWSPDDSVFYYVDSVEMRVDAFDFNIKEGTIDNRRTIFDLPSNGFESIPDGLTVDVMGNLWVATFFGSKILRIDPQVGKLIDTVEIPAKNVTSCTWGGSHYDELYVTTSALCTDLKEYPMGGSLFKVSGLGMKGFPNVPCNFTTSTKTA
ncbi:unnamed protein product [Notodromas monacha]|uniref:Regucalcin n=1 Tax=Notodromas monacha TaxID=399045 RepID=A0A7R9G8L3_9CRUS|nr:unnamed protein product [Notodromas monacha]CAG0913398.1 unnamed protein product [Notodromas monacha]